MCIRDRLLFVPKIWIFIKMLLAFSVCVQHITRGAFWQQDFAAKPGIYAVWLALAAHRCYNKSS